MVTGSLETTFNRFHNLLNEGRGDLALNLIYGADELALEEDVNGVTALITAADADIDDQITSLMLKALFEKGADVNHEANFEDLVVTPLYLTCKRGKLQSSKFLISKGAGLIEAEGFLYGEEDEEIKSAVIETLYQAWLDLGCPDFPNREFIDQCCQELIDEEKEEERERLRQQQERLIRVVRERQQAERAQEARRHREVPPINEDEIDWGEIVAVALFGFLFGALVIGGVIAFASGLGLVAALVTMAVAGVLTAGFTLLACYA